MEALFPCAPSSCPCCSTCSSSAPAQEPSVGLRLNPLATPKAAVCLALNFKPTSYKVQAKSKRLEPVPDEPNSSLTDTTQPYGSSPTEQSALGLTCQRLQGLFLGADLSASPPQRRSRQPPVLSQAFMPECNHCTSSNR